MGFSDPRHARPEEIQAWAKEEARNAVAKGCNKGLTALGKAYYQVLINQ
tara:strand:- start:3293 stop:3439 length:147 start_codon:yes stop_codon:yes gene_type:complete